MANFVNLMDVVYPVGSIYLTVNNVSPASSIGGTWTKIENCTLAAGGSTYGNAGAYNGTDTISTLEIPDHQHQVSAWNSGTASYSNCDFWHTNAGSGTGWQLLSYSSTIGGDTGWNLWTLGTWRIDANGNLVKEQEAHIPYHYSLYVWKRTA